METRTTPALPGGPQDIPRQKIHNLSREFWVCPRVFSQWENNPLKHFEAPRREADSFQHKRPETLLRAPPDEEAPLFLHLWMLLSASCITDLLIFDRIHTWLLFLVKSVESKYTSDFLRCFFQLGFGTEESSSHENPSCLHLNLQDSPGWPRTIASPPSSSWSLNPLVHLLLHPADTHKQDTKIFSLLCSKPSASHDQAFSSRVTRTVWISNAYFSLVTPQDALSAQWQTSGTPRLNPEEETKRLNCAALARKDWKQFYSFSRCCWVLLTQSPLTVCL